MAVIINEMEVVTEAQEPAPPEGGGIATEEDTATAQQPISPHDFECIYRMKYQRMLRVKAD